jgi:hypothetical protein
MRRILIAGGPKCGKTTLAQKISEASNLRVMHGDSLIGKKDWSEASQTISDWFERDGNWIIEGVQVPRAIRKWLNRHPDRMFPFTKVYFSLTPKIDLKPGQSTMLKGVETVWNQVVGALKHRGIEISFF